MLTGAPSHAGSVRSWSALSFIPVSVFQSDFYIRKCFCGGEGGRASLVLPGKPCDYLLFGFAPGTELWAGLTCLLLPVHGPFAPGNGSLAVSSGLSVIGPRSPGSCQAETFDSRTCHLRLLAPRQLGVLLSLPGCLLLQLPGALGPQVSVWTNRSPCPPVPGSG